MIEQVKQGGEVLAIIVRCDFDQKGIHFFTSNELSQQLAFMRHPAGKVIKPHVHNAVARSVIYTQETLVLRKGKLQVDFYDTEQNYLESKTLSTGDVILLIRGGHGFKVLEEVEMFEIKQGPYVGESDKTRFAGVSSEKLFFRE